MNLFLTSRLTRVYVYVLIVCTWLSCSPEPKPDAPQQQYEREKRFLGQTSEALRLHQAADSTTVALRLLKSAIATRGRSLSTDEEVRYRSALGYIAFDIGQYNETIEAFLPAALTILPCSRADYLASCVMIAHALKRQGDVRLALRWYRKAAGVAPEAPLVDIESNIMTMYYQLGELDSAIGYGNRAENGFMRQQRTDPNGSCWRRFIVGSAYVRLGNVQTGHRLMERAVRSIEKEKLHRSITEVRGRGADFDSMQTILRKYHSADHTLIQLLSTVARIQASDSTALLSMYHASVSVQANVPSVHNMLLPDPIVSGAVVPTILLTDATLSTEIDSHGRLWVETLCGRLLKIGDNCFPFLHPVQGDQTSSRHELPIVQTMRWINGRPNAVIDIDKTGRVLYIRGRAMGFGTSTQEPGRMRRIGIPADVVIHCGIGQRDSNVILGTSKGLWQLNSQTGICSAITTAPLRLMDANIDAMMYSGHGDIVVLSKDIGVFTSRDGRSFQQQMDASIPFIQQIASNAAKTFHLLVQQSHSHTVDNLASSRLPFFASMGTTAVSLLDAKLILYDVSHDRVCIRRLPAQVQRAISNDATVQQRGTDTLLFIDDDAMYVLRVPADDVLDEDDVFVISRARDSDKYAPVEPTSRIRLPAESRSVELVVGSYEEYVLTNVPIQIRASWMSGGEKRQVFGDIVRIEVPPGHHTIEVSVPNRKESSVIAIDAEATFSESPWTRTGGVLIVALALYLGVSNYRMRRGRKQQRDRMILLEERVSIGHDLHDALGKNLVNIARAARAIQGKEGATIVNDIRDATRTLRDILWSVSESKQTLDGLASVLANRIADLSEDAGIALSVVVPDQIRSLELEPRVARDAIMIMTEAALNSIKHSGTRSLLLEIRPMASSTEVSLSDCGHRIVDDKEHHGLGLKSMQRRSDRSGLNLSMTMTEEHGTTITITIQDKG